MSSAPKTGAASKTVSSSIKGSITTIRAQLPSESVVALIDFHMSNQVVVRPAEEQILDMEGHRTGLDEVVD